MRFDFIDGVEPAPYRLKAEQANIRKADELRAKGIYKYQQTGVHARSEGEVDKNGPAWTIYRAQLAAGMGEEDEPIPVEPRWSSGRPIRQMRESLGMSRVDLVRACGVHAGTLRRIESGYPCREVTQRKILDGLGVPWERRDEFFDSTG